MSSADAIPLADARSFAPRARRTRLVAAALAALAVALVAAAAALAPTSTGRQFLPAGTVGFVVLDLSSSIRPATYELIREELAALSATQRRLGLVVFSDTAYEALPPGTPARELRPFVRFFAPQPVRYDPNGFAIPATPWTNTFSGGTSISSGLLLAARLLARSHVAHAGVVLISDLADDPGDRGEVARAVLLYAQRHVALKVIALAPSSEDRRFFGQILGSSGSLETAPLPTGRRGRVGFAVAGTTPVRLVVLGALAAAALAALVLVAEPLAWRRRSA